MHATKAWNVCVLEHKDWNDMGESFKVSCNRAASVCSGLLWFLCCHLALFKVAHIIGLQVFVVARCDWCVVIWHYSRSHII